MNTLSLAKDLEPLVRNLKNSSTIKNISSLTAKLIEVDLVIPLIIEFAHKNHDNPQSLYNHTNALSQGFIKEVSPSKLIIDISLFTDSISQIFSKHLGDNNNFSLTAKQICQKILQAHDAFVGNQKASTAYLYLHSLSNFDYFLKNIYDTYSIINPNNGGELQKESDVVEFFIGFDTNSHSLTLLASKISSIDRAYKLIEELITKKPSTGLYLVKIETGSTWIRAIGKEIIINILATAIMNCSEYTYHKFVSTRERVALEHLDDDIFKATANVAYSIEEHGVKLINDSEESKTFYLNLKRSIGNLIEGESSIEIYNRSNSIRAEAKKEFLEWSSVKEIETSEKQLDRDEKNNGLDPSQK